MPLIKAYLPFFTTWTIYEIMVAYLVVLYLVFITAWSSYEILVTITYVIIYRFGKRYGRKFSSSRKCCLQ